MGPDYRIALRLDGDGMLDDVVVGDVSLFRAEMMDEQTLWMCCYLPGTGVEHDRIAFWVSIDRGRLRFETQEAPEGLVDLEPGTVLDAPEARRQSALAAASADADEDQAFVDAISWFNDEGDSDEHGA